jgi:transportin-1
MGLAPYLPQIVAMLIPRLADPRPMVRIISCWALGR